MENDRFDRVARTVGAITTRRSALTWLSALGLAGTVTWSTDADAKKKHKKKKKKCSGCCLADGSVCTRKSSKCKATHCLGTPLTIEARWTTVGADHDSFLFVPNEAGAALPAPFIDYDCTAAESACVNDLYPFTCVSQDASGPGPEVTTVRRLIAGTYEYWIELNSEAPAADLTVTLRRPNGSVVRSWSSPPNPGLDELSWHVFNLDGTSGSIVSIDQPSTGSLPENQHHPSTDVCPVA